MRQNLVKLITIGCLTLFGCDRIPNNKIDPQKITYIEDNLPLELYSSIGIGPIDLNSKSSQFYVLIKNPKNSQIIKPETSIDQLILNY